MPKYEIYQREKGQRREGHFAMLVDGEDAQFTVDHTQFLPKATALIAAEKKVTPQLAIDAEALAQDMAIHVFERKIEGLRRGDVPLGIEPGGQFKQGGGVRGATSRERNLLRKNADEKRAVELFMNRGKLKDRDAKARKQMLVAPKHDSYQEWLANRTALIKRREEELSKWQQEYEKGNPRAEARVQALSDEITALKAPVQNASHGLQYAFTQYWLGAINLATDDIRIWPLMTNTTLDTVRDAVDTFSDITADEFDGAGYTSGGLALDNQAVAVDDANDRAEFSADDEAVTLSAGTRSIQGVAVGKFNTNTAASLPLHWIEFATVKTPDGSLFTFDFSATDGLMYMTG